MFVIGAIFGLLMIAFANVIADISETPEMAIGIMVLAPCVLNNFNISCS